MKLNKVLFVGAHPDDIELASSGFIKQLVDKGSEVLAIICSSGSLGGDSNQRCFEQKESSRLMNIKFINLEWQDGNIQMTGNTVGELEKIIMSDNYDLIVTHYFEDTHQDHRTISQIIKSICYRKNINLIYFDANSSINFIPNFFVPINWDFKESVIKVFKSQVERSNILKKAKIKAKFYGVQSDNDFAEGYKIEKVVWNE